MICGLIIILEKRLKKAGESDESLTFFSRGEWGKF